MFLQQCCDIVEFTPLCRRHSAEEIVNLLDSVFTSFDEIAERHGLERFKTIGDAYVCIGSNNPRICGEEGTSSEVQAMKIVKFAMEVFE